MTISVNKKIYTLTNRISKTYSIIINNFAFAVTFIFRIRDHMVLTFNVSSIKKLVTIIVIKRVRLIISVVELITKITQTINSRTIKAIYTIRERMKFVTIITFHHPFIFIMRARQKLVSIIYQGVLRITANPTLATFFTLGYFDPDTLGTWDASTLGNMDYTA